MYKQGPKGFCTDSLMLHIWGTLVSDFRSVCGETFGIRHAGFIQRGDIKGYRSECWPLKSQAPVHIFKRVYQMENLFKRYRFTQDAYTTAELSDMTDEKFSATQCRLNMYKPSSQRAHLVLQRARRIVKDILGNYDEEEHMSLCRFGKKASVGSPKPRSYLDLKLEENPLTGSLAHTRWFTESYLPTDDILSAVFARRPQGCETTVCETLTNTNVPKSWKSLRSIMPNTLLGSFYTHGLGKMVEKRLRDHGLNLKTLQMQHQILARSSSRTRKLVTADLSAASDSIVSWTLNTLLPRKWFNAVKFGRISNTRMGKQKSVTHMCSFMGMGVGFTFTLQTLVFYGLIKAIMELLGTSGTVSVYGDDLIYPRNLHRYVKVIFAECNFQLNTDKTFCEDSFRESCGGDFFRGVDVRPFQPEGQGRVVSRLEYLGFIYKTINGLLRRWDRVEIESTLLFLYKEILRVHDRIFQVPPDYPDYSGIQVENPNDTWYIPYSPVVYSPSKCCNVFQCLDFKSQRRFVVHQHSYYWDVMRSSSSNEVIPPPCLPPSMSIKTYLRYYRHFVRESAEEVFGWIKAMPRKVVKSRISGLRLRRLVATVPSKEPGYMTTSVGATSLWTKGVK